MSRFRMPAEWELQAAIWLGWPHNVETWPLNLAAAQSEFVALVRTVSESQLVQVMVPQRKLALAGLQLERISNANVVPIETNDAWARDYAPTFVKDVESGELVSIDWYYNAWGGKYPPFDLDQRVSSKVADHLRIRNIAGGLCFEGGAIEINQRGVLMTTESCALDPNRNAGKSRLEVESILIERLGCSEVVWLPGDLGESKTLIGDDTDCHIDQLARFVDDDTIVHAWTTESDSRFEALKLNVAAIKAQLPSVQLVPLMLPEAFEFCDRMIPASYCNFLITNDSVIVPQFDVPGDEAAVEVLRSLFSNRNIVPLASRNLSVGLGSFHCLSQQQPA
jgi:agmatine deiminase